MPLLLVASMTPGTGNAVTASRLAALLCSLRPLTLGACPPILIDAGSPDAGDRVHAALAAGCVDLAVAVHAYRAGRHFVGAADALARGGGGGSGGAGATPTTTATTVSARDRGTSTSTPSPVHVHAHVPLVVVLGGTDINVDAVPLMQPQWWRDGSGGGGGGGGAAAASHAPPPPSSRQVAIADTVRRSLSRASAVVAFTADMAARFSVVAHGLDPPPPADAAGAATGAAEGAASGAAAAARRVFVIPQAVADEDSHGDGGTGGVAARGAGGISHGARNPTDGALGGDSTPAAPAAAPHPSLRSLLGLPPSAVVLLLVAGLRPVKRPLALAPAIAAWHAVEPRVHLVIVGPALDPEVAAAVVATTGCDPRLVATGPLSHAAALAEPAYASAAPSRFGGAGGVWYVPFVPRAALLAWLRAPGGVTAVVNSSSSEGQPGALLEAQAAGVPVVASCVAGNVTVVEHGVSGLLFHTPAGALRAVAKLVGGAEGLRPPPLLGDGGGGEGWEGGGGEAEAGDAGGGAGCAVCGEAVYGAWSEGGVCGGAEAAVIGGRCGCGCSGIGGSGGGGGGGTPRMDSAGAASAASAAGADEEEGARLRARLVAGGLASVRARHSEEGEALRWEEVLRAVLPA